MKITDDLTKGDMKRQLIALAIPLILGNMLQQFYNTMDSFIVGNFVSQQAFAALGVAGSIMNLFLFIINGCCNGISIVFSQLFGQKNRHDIKKEAFLSITFGMLFSVLLMIAGYIFLDDLLLYIETPGEIKKLVTDYLTVIILFLPATYLYNWCAAVLRALGDSKTSLYILFFAMLLNALLDFMFVVSFKKGVSGAALATVTAQIFASVVCLAYIKKNYPDLLFSRKEMTFDKTLFLTTIRFGVVCALHQSSLYIGKLLVQGAVNSAGIDIIAAYAVTMRIEGFINSFGDSGSTAISIIVGQNMGAKKSNRVKDCFITGVKMMLILCISLSLLTVAITKPIIYVFISQPSKEMIHNIFFYMVVISFFYIFCFLGNCFVGLYKGMGMIHIPVIGTILHISIRV